MIISVITINFNNAVGLNKTINSVIHQEFKDFEYIIIDGGSNDGSLNIIKENENEIDYWVSEKDKGIYDAINKGINVARSEYLIFLNSGDSFADDKVLSIYSDSIRTYPETHIFYSDIKTVSTKGMGSWRHPDNLNISYFKKNNLNHQATLIRKTLFTEFGLYPSEYKLAGDHWLYLVSFINNKEFRYIRSYTIAYDTEGRSFSKRSAYEAEMKTMWETHIPAYVDKLVNEYLEVNYTASYPFQKKLIVLDRIYTYKKKEIVGIFLLIVIVILLLIYKL